MHEKVAVAGRTAVLKSPIVHETYRSLGEFLRRMDVYSTLAAKEMLREGRRCRVTDLIFRPPFTFVQMFLLRAGFLEGYFGFVLSAFYSFYTFAKYTKLREMEKGHEPRS